MASLIGRSYDSSDNDEPAVAIHDVPDAGSAIVPAPDVSLEDPMKLRMMLAQPTDTVLTYNVPYDDLTRPFQGPANPFKSAADGGGLGGKRKNLLTGYAEETVISDATFLTQHRTFQGLGYAQNPSREGAYVGNMANVQRFGGRNVVQLRPSKAEAQAIRRKRQKKGDAAIVEGEGAYQGPWARYHDQDQALEDEAAQAGERLGSDEEYEEEGGAAASGTVLRPARATTAGGSGATEAERERERTEFNGTAEFDYQGRTYMHVPQDLELDLRKEVGSITNYVPKKMIHTWRQHTKAITGLRFLPQSGHVLLSASADATIRIWDVYHARELLRTIYGHTKAVSDVSFNDDGSRFLSASYDRQMKVWDTEYGKCLGRYSTGKIPHVVRFHPAAAHRHEFLAGMSDKKIVQYDTRSGSLTQEYDHHLGAINTITFVDQDRRFITTSDDKSLRAWEYNIPVPIKFIAEPYMFSMVRAARHPSGKYLALQSADNQIVVYAATDKFRQNRKKAFRGHHTAGHAIDLAFSPDGHFLASGDDAGYLCVWDFKTCKMLHKIRAYPDAAALLAVQWHPQETSKVVTGGLDGVIKYFD